jgi:hypothetical protein
MPRKSASGKRWGSTAQKKALAKATRISAMKRDAASPDTPHPNARRRVVVKKIAQQSILARKNEEFAQKPRTTPKVSAEIDKAISRTQLRQSKVGELQKESAKLRAEADAVSIAKGNPSGKTIKRKAVAPKSVPSGKRKQGQKELAVAHEAGVTGPEFKRAYRRATGKSFDSPKPKDTRSAAEKNRLRETAKNANQMTVFTRGEHVRVGRGEVTWVVGDVKGDKITLHAHSDTRRLSSGRLPSKTVPVTQVSKIGQGPKSVAAVTQGVRVAVEGAAGKKLTGTVLKTTDKSAQVQFDHLDYPTWEKLSDINVSAGSKIDSKGDARNLVGATDAAKPHVDPLAQARDIAPSKLPLADVLSKRVKTQALKNSSVNPNYQFKNPVSKKSTRRPRIQGATMANKGFSPR